MMKEDKEELRRGRPLALGLQERLFLAPWRARQALLDLQLTTCG